MTKKQKTKELLSLCCAVCGPLSKEEISLFFSSEVIDASFPKNSSLLRLTTQLDFPSLQCRFDSSPILRRLCEALMARRSADQRNIHSRIPESTRCISAARYALLTKNSIEFQRLHRLYRSMPHLGGRVDLPRAEFWDGVLGQDWLGLRVVPAGVAREEIRSLVAARYMLLPQPKSDVVELEELPLVLSLGWGMLHADMHLKPQPVSSVDIDEERDVDIVLARAYWNLWAGSWENAYRCFHQLFRARESHIRALVGPYGGGIMLMAAIAAIRAHASPRTVELWLKIARDLSLQAIPQWDIISIEEISAFFDSLHLWDAVENRSCRQCILPEERGPLSLIPLAMGARAIVRNTGIQLPVIPIVRAIQAARERGLVLLAFYAASSLLNAPGMDELPLDDLSVVLDDCSFKPLYEKSTKKRSKILDEQWEQIISVVDTQRGGDKKWLYWDISLDRFNSISGIEPRLVEKRPRSAGRKIELDELYDPNLVNCQEKEDLAVISLARSLQNKNLSGVPLLAEALVGHPRIRLVEGSYHRIVEVRSTRPVIQVSVQSFCLHLSLDIRQFYRVAVEESYIVIPSFCARMQGVLNYFSKGPISLDLSQTERLRWLIAQLSEFFTLQGNIPHSLLESSAPPPQFVIHASVYDNGYLFDLDVSHLPDSSAHDLPGQGERVQLLTSRGESICIMRDFETEISAACEIMERCPTLKSIENDDFQWLFLSEADALQAIHELACCEVPVRWQSSPAALEIIEPVVDSLQISVQKKCSDWFEIGADLPVDEQLICSLDFLLESYARRAGDFLHLGGSRYLHMSPMLADQMQILSESLREENGRWVLPMMYVPGFASQWQGAQLPAPLLARRYMLDECASAPAPAGLSIPLRDYQLEGFRWLLSRAKAGLGSCLADDMGLGKTVQVLALLLHLAPAGPSLVVAPVSLSNNWLTEASRFAPSLRVQPWIEAHSDKINLEAGDVVIATYGQMISSATLQQQAWNIVALDEAQAIKNPSSRRAIIACSLNAAVRLCLTGTPVENSLQDLWSLMRFLNPTLLGSLSEFSSNKDVDISRLRRITAPLILRRKKEEVLPQLPPVTELIISIDLTPEERAIYETCRRQALDIMHNGEGAVILLAQLTRLRRLCCHGKLVFDNFTGESSKLRLMVQLVEELLDAEHCILIFSQFTDVLDLAQDVLLSSGITPLRLDGGMPPAQRGKQVRLFQEGVARVFLISLRAGGVGLNLTAADYVILLDPWWNPAVEAQAASRSHRYGQNNPVTVCRLISRGTVEERIMQMHEAKQALADSVIHDGTMPLETLREILT